MIKTILRGQDGTGETCQRCGVKYLTVYSLPDDVWAAICGGYNLLCPQCADALALAGGVILYWGILECHVIAQAVGQVEGHDLTPSDGEMQKHYENREMFIKPPFELQDLSSGKQEEMLALLDQIIKRDMCGVFGNGQADEQDAAILKDVNLLEKVKSLILSRPAVPNAPEVGK